MADYLRGWRIHFDGFRSENPEMEYKKQQQLASQAWHEMHGTKKKAKPVKKRAKTTKAAKKTTKKKAPTKKKAATTKSKKGTIAAKRKECKEKGQVMDKDTHECREPKKRVRTKGSTSTKKASAKKSTSKKVASTTAGKSMYECIGDVCRLVRTKASTKKASTKKSTGKKSTGKNPKRLQRKRM
jgi:hypothetical protein